MNSGEIHISHIVGAVIVSDLSAGPVHAFDLDGFAGDDLSDGGDCAEETMLITTRARCDIRYC